MTDPQHVGAHRADADQEQNLTSAEEADLRGRHRGDNIVLNDAAFAGREAVETRHVAALEAIDHRAQGLTDEAEVARIVQEELDTAGLEIPPVQRDRIVEQIIRGGPLVAVSRDDGTVVLGDADPADLQSAQPPAGADPAHPDRPSYS